MASAAEGCVPHLPFLKPHGLLMGQCFSSSTSFAQSKTYQIKYQAPGQLVLVTKACFHSPSHSPVKLTTCRSQTFRFVIPPGKEGKTLWNTRHSPLHLLGTQFYDKMCQSGSKLIWGLCCPLQCCGAASWPTPEEVAAHTSAVERLRLLYSTGARSHHGHIVPAHQGNPPCRLQQGALLNNKWPLTWLVKRVISPWLMKLWPSK